MPIKVTIEIKDLRRDDKDRSAEHVQAQLLEAVKSENMKALLGSIMPVPAARTNLTGGKFLLFGEAGIASPQPIQRFPTGLVTATRED